MSIELKLRRGTTTEHSTFTGAEGEITVDKTKKTIVVHDGATVGGFPLVKEGNEKNAETILTKPVDIASFAGLDGYILAYDETSDKFYLKKDEGAGGGGGLLESTNSFFQGVSYPNSLVVTTFTI